MKSHNLQISTIVRCRALAQPELGQRQWKLQNALTKSSFALALFTATWIVISSSYYIAIVGSGKLIISLNLQS